LGKRPCPRNRMQISSRIICWLPLIAMICIDVLWCLARCKPRHVPRSD
jgi:hypothetical protein